MANISSINGNPIVPSNGSVGTAQVASGYNLMTDDEKSKLSGVPAQGNTPFSSINGNPIMVGNRGIEDEAVSTEKIGNGAVATDKLADGAVTGDKLATDIARDRERLQYRLANLLTAQLPDGDVATATDAAKTPMAGLALYGRSTQDGTPTPSAPVPIVSVEPDSDGNISLLSKRTSDATQQSVTPIPLDGHELRSLPDGTRDEVTVDERGHAVLVQRVGSAEITAFDGTGAGGGRPYGYKTINGKSTNTTGNRLLCDKLTTTNGSNYYIHNNPANVVVMGLSGQAQTDLGPAVLPLTVQYPLATPVTIDLGYVDAVPLVGPDLTAQAIPTAPFALTYERDLNTTLARLESAIATLA